MSKSMDRTVHPSVKKISIKPLPFIQQMYDKRTSDQADNISEQDLQTSITKAEVRLQELKQEQQDVESQTIDQIEQLRVNWSEERLQLVEEAKKAGYQEGFELGKKEAEKQYTEIVYKANELTKIAEVEHILRIEQSTTSVIELAIQIAEKIMNQEMERNADALQMLVQAAITEVKDQPDIHIHVPAAHYESILLQKNEFVQIMNGKAEVSVYIAPEEECYITHPLGKIDISIDTQLTQMREKLIEIAVENQL